MTEFQRVFQSLKDTCIKNKFPLAEGFREVARSDVSDNLTIFLSKYYSED